MNERLSVNVGGNVNVEGSEQRNDINGPPSQVVSDITAEYRLTKDGKIRLLLFRNNQYAGLIEGQVIETGTGIIFVKDFNRYRQLFRKQKRMEVKGNEADGVGSRP